LTDEQKRFFSQHSLKKNRIQEFSLFGSKDTGIKKEHILSVLIGMDELTSLVNSFVQFPAFKTNLQGFKRQAVENEINELGRKNLANLSLQKTYVEIIQQNQDKLDQLLNKPSASMQDLDAEMLAIDKEVEEMNKETFSLSSSTFVLHEKKDFEDLKTAIDTEFDSLEINSLLLEEAKSQLSFRDLYSAVNKLNDYSNDTCPACDTPLSQVATNPFDKANEELQKLQGLSEQEEQAEIQKKNIEEKVKKLKELHNSIFRNINSSELLRKHFKSESEFLNENKNFEVSSKQYSGNFSGCGKL
jgi:DNA sulfur modification protein DndD